MKKLKYVKLFFVVTFLLFFICYLMGAFAMASFDITTWNPQHRMVLSFGGGSMCILFSALIVGGVIDNNII